MKNLKIQNKQEKENTQEESVEDVVENYVLKPLI